jgi:hypothetical protein
MKTRTKFHTAQAFGRYLPYTIIAILSAMLFAPLVVAEEMHNKSEHEFHRHHAALIVGNTQNDGNENGLSIGIDYEYRINQWVGLGGLVEYAGGDFEHLLLAVPIFIHPHSNWLLKLAGGAEIHNAHGDHEEDKREREWIIRTGIAYQFPLADNWTIAPEFNVDFSEHETLFVYGISIGFGF